LLEEMIELLRETPGKINWIPFNLTAFR